MILSRFARMQLRVFSVATVIGAVILGVFFLRIPESMGVGRYVVTAEFSRAAGLYDGAQVNYRGVRVGNVSDLRVEGAGIAVDLRLDDDIEIPDGVRAEIHSMSAVGEQYVDLVPYDDAPDTGVLGEGDRIPRARTTIPVEIGPVLDNVSALVDSLPTQALTNLLEETSTGFSGRAGDMQTILDGSADFMEAADASLEPTKRLINESGPLLHSVNSSSSSIKRLTTSIAQVGDVFRAGDADLRSLLENGPGLATETTAFLNDLERSLPRMLKSSWVVTGLLARYNDNLAGVLESYPKLVSVLQSISLPFTDTDQMQLALANINNPGSCTRGFLPKSQWRDPSDLTTVPNPLVYCKESQSDHRVVKGARNLPCVDFPGRRAATPALCRQGR